MHRVIEGCFSFACYLSRSDPILLVGETSELNDGGQ